MKKLIIITLALLFFSSCTIIYYDYPTDTVRIPYIQYSFWGGWTNLYWSNLWYMHRYTNYHRTYSPYSYGKTIRSINKEQLQRPKENREQFVRSNPPQKSSSSSQPKADISSKTEKIKK